MSEQQEKPSNRQQTSITQEMLDKADWVPVFRKVSAEVDDFPFATAAKGEASAEPRKREVKKDRVWFINMQAPPEAVALASKLMDAPED